MNVSGEILRTYAKKPIAIQAHIERLLESYETACALSRGPIADRAAFWERKARAYEADLRARLGLNAERSTLNASAGAA